MLEKKKKYIKKKNSFWKSKLLIYFYFKRGVFVSEIE